MIVLQYLNKVRGLRGWLRRVTAPDVKEVCVWRWASDNTQDTVPHSVLRQAFPKADLEYYGGTERKDE